MNEQTGTDVRNGNPMRNKAKNAITRLTHSLTYQARTARGKVSGFDFTEAENKKDEVGGVKKQKVAGPAQRTLSFGNGGGGL